MGQPIFYLTFDDGPYEHPAKMVKGKLVYQEHLDGGTEIVLRVLKDFQIKATFFICSRSNGITQGRQYDLINQMMKEGHVLGSHGDDHSPASPESYAGITTGKKQMKPGELTNYKADTTNYKLVGGKHIFNIEGHVLKDFAENQAAFKKLFLSKGKKDGPHFIGTRLPGDGRNQRHLVQALVKKTKLPHFGWHFEFAPDGKLPSVPFKKWNDVEGVSANHVQKELPKDQDILLLHDGHWLGHERQFRSLLKKLAALGRFKTLDKLPAKPSARFQSQVMLYK